MLDTLEERLELVELLNLVVKVCRPDDWTEVVSEGKTLPEVLQMLREHLNITYPPRT